MHFELWHEQGTLLLVRRRPMADARKSTCERTLRGCFRVVQDFRMLFVFALFTACILFSCIWVHLAFDGCS